MAIDDFPRQLASTRYFTLGFPHAVTVARDGGRVLFLRTQGGEDPVTCLWRMDLSTARDGSGCWPIRRRCGTPALVTGPRPSASGGNGPARPRPES